MAGPTLLYDVRTEPLPVGGAVKGGVASLVVGALLLAIVWKRKDRGPRLFALLWIAGSLVLFGWNGLQAARAHQRAAGWLASGDVEVVEGEVRDFSAARESSAGLETFRVGDVIFKMDGDATRTPGLQERSGEGGPVRAGAKVRIAHHGPSILRVEELAPPPTPAAPR